MGVKIKVVKKRGKLALRKHGYGTCIVKKDKKESYWETGVRIRMIEFIVLYMWTRRDYHDMV